MIVRAKLHVDNQSNMHTILLKPKLSNVEPHHQDDLPLSDKNGGWTCLELMLAADFSSRGRVYKEQSDWR